MKKTMKSFYVVYRRTSMATPTKKARDTFFVTLRKVLNATMYREAGLESLEHARSDFTFELSRCYWLKSACFLCQCIFFYVICFATLMSFNSRNTVNTPCMDYITISRMILTPIYGWLFCCCVLHLVVWWPYRFWYAIIHGIISYLLWHGQ